MPSCRCLVTHPQSPSHGKKAEKLGQRQSRLGFRMKVGMLRLGGILFQRMGFLLAGMGTQLTRQMIQPAREWFGRLLTLPPLLR